MPPKQPAEQPNSSYKPIYVLPVVFDSIEAEECLRKPVTIKKNIDQNKIIEILKDKGLQQYLNQNEIKSEGRKFVCQNYKTVCDEFIASINKPVDPKKDPKKDKKEAKKEEVVEEPEQPLQINYDKECSDFYFMLDFPTNQEELQQILSLNIRVDIVVLIESKVKPGSRKPDFSLLFNERSVEKMESTLKNTLAENVEDQKQKIQEMRKRKKLIVEKFIELRAKTQSIKEGTIVVQVPFLNDLSNSQTNSDHFIDSLYKKLCTTTVEKKQYDEWKTTKTPKPMIQPMKEVVKKEVQVQREDKGKKGGKSEPVFETIQQVVQTKYESLPGNIKSDLKTFKKTSKYLEKGGNKTQSVFNNIIDACLQMFQESTETDLHEITSNIQSIYESRPVNKVNKDTLVNRVRKVTYPKDITMREDLHFEYKNIDSDVSLLQLAHKADGNIQSLQIQYIVSKLQQITKAALPKIKWDFGDRQFVQRFSAPKLTGIINQQLLKDPEIVCGFLEDEGIRLLVLTRTNPPGRVLYHNSMMDWKVVPDFQNWTDSFNGNEEMLAKDDFYDYPCADCGNLAIKAKNMMPTDNTIIKDQLFTIGQSKDNIIQFYQDHCIFGMKNKNKNHVYWHRFQNGIQVKAFKTALEMIKKTQVVENEEKPQNQVEQHQSITEEQVEIDCTQLWVKYKNNYNVSFSPYPTIIWNNNPFETKRQFGSKGEITCYRRDGSIDIYFPDGSVSSFRNGKWTKIIGNELIKNQGKQKIETDEIIEGQTTITIRADQTIFIEEKGNVKRIIFPDSTQIYQNKTTRKREIKNPLGPLIRINLPRDIDFNVIGHGSAFAYLGFKNVLERSYDGFMYEFIDTQFTSHMYIEKFELDEKQYTEEVRLLSFKDGSQIKILGEAGKIVYISPNNQKLMTEEYQNERWLQLFTTPENFGEGVYDIDIKNGSISTFDKESNKFKTKVGNPSEVNIAVSFSIDESQKESENYPNGFHVPPQNYFLPPPNNSIPPRLFSINADGSGRQYLNSHQIGSFHDFHVEQEFQGERTVRQYSRIKQSNKQYMKLTFTENVDINKFGLPSRLRAQETVSNLVPNTFEEMEHRVIEGISWNEDFSRVKGIEKQIRREREEKKRTLGKLK